MLRLAVWSTTLTHRNIYRMLKVLASVHADPVKDSLPKELAILVHDLSSDLPTHMLAIYGRRQPALPHLKKSPYSPYIVSSSLRIAPNFPNSPSLLRPHQDPISLIPYLAVSPYPSFPCAYHTPTASPPSPRTSTPKTRNHSWLPFFHLLHVSLRL